MTYSHEGTRPFASVQPTDAADLETLFIGLVRDYQRRIFNYVFRIVGDAGLAEDLTQEAYLRAYRGLPRLDAGANYRAWLYRIATNVATDELRRRRRRPRLSMGLSPTLAALTISEDAQLGRIQIDGALMRVAPQHRSVLLLFEYFDLSAPEVGEVLNISPEAARKRRQRAREALAKELKVSR